MDFGKANWRTFERGIEKEWLITNGIGGFASSTIIGANTRRYHGLLTASLKPPINRHLIISNIHESIDIKNRSIPLNSFITHDRYTMNGYLNLQRVVVDPLPTFFYSVNDILIDKKISMVYGENTTVIVYHIINGADDISLNLTPLINFRDYHHNSNKDYLNFNQRILGNELVLTPLNYNLDIKVFCSEGTYNNYENSYFYNMYYPLEEERGLSSIEDHFIPGNFKIKVAPFEEKYISIILSTEDKIKNTDGVYLIEKEKNRMIGLLDTAGYRDIFAQNLVKAADNFIVHRKSTNGKTIIAGYPWFTDWGRDTMIALTGLTLTTRRYTDAQDILYTFSKYVKNGLIPNMFPDEGQEPLYNSVDAALWYFEAVNNYIKYTGDYDFIKLKIYDSLKQIINAYINGTLFNIKMDKDNLITAGDEKTQLTWMDAKVGDWVVTPRQGKAVEINALWFNALMVMTELAKKYNDNNLYYEDIAKGVRTSFSNKFWNEKKQCLYDVISDDNSDDSVRPNQILAVGLSYPVIEGTIAKKVVQKVWKELYTAYGLRSLSKESKDYVGIYKGDQYKRDGAYHQGTVWTWPIGYFITAYVKVNGYSKESRQVAVNFIKPFIDHLSDGCIGSISEIFDGDEPLLPRGCFAQAWSVAEVLRAYIEDILMLAESSSKAKDIEGIY